MRDEQQAASAGRLAVSSRLAGEFHTRLAQMTGNPLLERYLSEVVTRCSLILAVYGRPHASDCACSEHLELIEAFRAQDTDRAVLLMGEHLRSLQSRALLPEVVRDGPGLGAVLSRYADEFAGSGTGLALKTPPKSPRTRTASR